MCKRHSNEALALPTWTCEYKERLCTAKHGEGHKPSKISYPTCTLVCEGYTDDKQYAAKWGNDAERQATKSLEIEGEWFERLKEFQAFVEMQFEHEIKVFQ